LPGHLELHAFTPRRQTRRVTRPEVGYCGAGDVLHYAGKSPPAAQLTRLQNALLASATPKPAFCMPTSMAIVRQRTAPYRGVTLRYM